MANSYILGNAVTLAFIYQQLDDPFAATATYSTYDPATPTLKIQLPDLTLTTIAGGSLSRPASPTGTGRYYYVYKFLVIGSYKYEWIDPDATKPLLMEGAFSVKAAKI